MTNKIISVVSVFVVATQVMTQHPLERQGLKFRRQDYRTRISSNPQTTIDILDDVPESDCYEHTRKPYSNHEFHANEVVTSKTEAQSVQVFPVTEEAWTERLSFESSITEKRQEIENVVMESVLPRIQGSSFSTESSNEVVNVISDKYDKTYLTNSVSKKTMDRTFSYLKDLRDQWMDTVVAYLKSVVEQEQQTLEDTTGTAELSRVVKEGWTAKH